MRWTLRLALVLTAVAAPAIAQVPGYTHFAKTEHLRIAWNDSAISDEDVAVLQREGEQHYTAIRQLLGHAPSHAIVVLLEGPAERPDGTRGYPHVDGWGRVHLYRYGPTYHDYKGAFAHELVHAMRIGFRPRRDWFFEEGLAELIALRVDEDLRGFPWYGFSVVVAAGQWVARGQDIPLAKLRDEHRTINLPCKAQSYTLRSSFFDYLGSAFGDEAVLEMAKQDRPGAFEDYEKSFGKDFDTLVADWRAALLAAYESITDADAQAKRYRTETPIQYMPVCDSEGVVQR